MLKKILSILLSLVLLFSLGFGSIDIEAAGDYNSSRSNRPSPSAENEDDDEDGRLDLENNFKVLLKIGEKRALKIIEENLLNVAPFIQNGRTMVPFRFIGEQLGAEITWDEKERKVSYKLGEDTVHLWIDKNMALVNEKEVFIDEDKSVVPIIKDGSTIVPIRFISESLGSEVKWNPDTEEIVLEPAQDYNSSRSNRPSPISSDNLDGNEDES